MTTGQWATIVFAVTTPGRLRLATIIVTGSAMVILVALLLLLLARPVNVPSGLGRTNLQQVVRVLLGVLVLKLLNAELTHRAVRALVSGSPMELAMKPAAFPMAHAQRLVQRLAAAELAKTTAVARSVVIPKPAVFLGR